MPPFLELSLMKDFPGIPSETKERLCKKAKDKGKTKTVEYFVFEDMLDTGETLISRSIEESGFTIFTYHLLKKSKNIFKKWDKIDLGCFIGFKKGILLKFEDLNFAIKELENFTLLVEAVEIETGAIINFNLINVSDLPKALKYEVPVRIALFSETENLLPESPKSPIEKECIVKLIKLALKGMGKAIDKLEKLLPDENVSLLLKRIRRNPENYFKSVILHTSKEKYTIIGKVIQVEETEIQGIELFHMKIAVENFLLSVITKKTFKAGERVKLFGKLTGYYDQA
ncbi:hypothetical protein [Desulfurobacterium atlanticum]|uniref:Uncharacterized protein n=1 Tax=Desulfurobacterium atlanticum TaxID=240169 RepID=A0A238Y2Z5_9BACT|nr:hypothetical protein [Desulfurobacterium atlanticum]SNR65342.1 hypothetical protein SAMN06265340_10262 [Desulfurobacterium atlanticum]